jgi:hypothetical protein
MNLDDDQIELIQEQRDAAITEEEMDFEEEIV